MGSGDVILGGTVWDRMMLRGEVSPSGEDVDSFRPEEMVGDRPRSSSVDTGGGFFLLRPAGSEAPAKLRAAGLLAFACASCLRSSESSSSSSSSEDGSLFPTDAFGEECMDDDDPVDLPARLR